MNKTQKTLVLIGAASVVGALALGYFAWDASSATAEAEEQLEGTRINVSNLSSIKLGREKGAKTVTPCVEAVKLLKENAKRYEAWCAESRELASGGDVLFESTTPPAFKAKMVADAKRLSECPGGVDGKLVAHDFAFGFSEFITGGKLPAQADLPQLQREWHDVVAVVDVLAETGASSVDEIVVVRAKAEEAVPQPTRSRKGKKQQEPEEPTSAKTVLSVTFHATPECLVGALNAFATNETFMVAEEVSFGRENDELGTKLGGSKAVEETNKSGRKRRVRGAVVPAVAEKPAETPAAEFKGGVLTNPQDPGDFKVTMKVTVHDFLTAAKKAEAAAKSSEAAEAEAETEEEE